MPKLVECANPGIGASFPIKVWFSQVFRWPNFILFAIHPFDCLVHEQRKLKAWTAGEALARVGWV